MKRRVLINATSCTRGGGIQVATGFIRRCISVMAERGWKVRILAGEEVARQTTSYVDGSDAEMLSFAGSAAGILGGRAMRREILKASDDFGSDVVFTVFGPSYVKFKVPEMIGFALGFALFPNEGGYANHSFVATLVGRLRNRIKLGCFKSGTEFWVETETARQALAKQLRRRPEEVHVVMNGVNQLIFESSTGIQPGADNEILLLGSDYPHKNHRLISKIAPILERELPGLPWRFCVTTKEDSPVWTQLKSEFERMNLSHRLKNLGVLSIKDCARAIESSVIVFHPSLLEIFSATYVEAMALGRPLVVSDRPFAREVCGPAAAYFDPLNPQAAAETLSSLLRNEQERENLVRAGSEQVRQFPDASLKNDKLCDLLDRLIERTAVYQVSN